MRGGTNIVNDVEIRFFGKTAVAYGNETITAKNGEKTTLVWTDIWHYRNGQWQLIAAQDVVKQTE